MFSSAIQGHVVQARVEELHRSAQRPGATPLSTRVKRLVSRVVPCSLAGSDEFAAIHGVQFVGHPATTRSQRS
jgi:hypothetical protein